MNWVKKLFALITLKNIFPNEFDLLQEDEGFIRTVFDRLESERKTVVDNLKQKLDEIDENIKFINSKIENDKFEVMALRISTDVRPYNAQHKTISQFLKDWSKTPDNRMHIQYPSGNKQFLFYLTKVRVKAYYIKSAYILAKQSLKETS